eukprot:scaffold17971_cov101-Isochrysis_galbana.AAC.1
MSGRGWQLGEHAPCFGIPTEPSRPLLCLGSGMSGTGWQLGERAHLKRKPRASNVTDRFSAKSPGKGEAGYQFCAPASVPGSAGLAGLVVHVRTYDGVALGASSCDWGVAWGLGAGLDMKDGGCVAHGSVAAGCAGFQVAGGLCVGGLGSRSGA